MPEKLRFLRAVACCMMALMLTACLGKRSEQDGTWTYAGGFAPEVLDIDEELDIDSGMNSAWVNPRELVDDAAANPDLCEGDCLGDSLEIGESRELLPWEEPDDVVLGADPALPSKAAPRRDAKRRVQQTVSGRAMITASMPSGRIPRPAHEIAAMCSGNQTICISSPFGVRRPGHVHKGVDIRAPFGSPIKAFRSGVVEDARWHHSYGKVVDVRQDDGIIARYAHMSQILVKAGDRVWQGQVVGRVGSTGRSTGPHLHFELIRGSQHMNPMVQLRAPAHVVSHATERDTAQARLAMAHGSQHSGHALSRRSRLIDRHVPAKARHRSAQKGKLSKGAHASFRNAKEQPGAKRFARPEPQKKSAALARAPQNRLSASSKAQKPVRLETASRSARHEQTARGKSSAASKAPAKQTASAKKSAPAAQGKAQKAAAPRKEKGKSASSKR